MIHLLMEALQVIATFYLVGYLVLIVVSVENPLFMGK